MKTQLEKAQAFVDLHRRGNCFVIPNPWDAGSAKLLEHLGYQALAGTSAGFAFSKAKTDPTITIAEMLPHLAELAAATDLPLSADLQSGFGAAPEDAARTIVEAAATGIVGGSIEDATDDPDAPLFDIGLATDRIRAAVEAARGLPFKFMLTARAENFRVGRPDLADTIRRLQAYQEAGADVLFAPGIAKREDIAAVVRAVDRPVNFMAGASGLGLTVAELAALGVTRVSLGASLARAAYGALVRDAKEVLEQGTFGYADDALPAAELNRVFTAP
ncbi:isocitrate lyase/phosphoenolpyruvate mutase family protein [Massilia sp. NEAU-DD11]|uniref:Isocitrate lyase/phosphoenolpyruvate mutase family protein n=1 Tax=Massilia cellulosiltytica TaxID=2683234 RepID=A0A7X3FXJ5_9BURK|nr:isocitrate lyase/phosphoenolpyruvate mutase family protein [Telluria cellulosilytica]MVW59797.1 isocitrate lyase/phosphoenolpyruvate mutase family protein [Telluria cellulosilytica]